MCIGVIERRKGYNRDRDPLASNPADTLLTIHSWHH